MKRPRVRIGTLMLLVVIAGLLIAFVGQERRHARSLATEKQRRDDEIAVAKAQLQASAKKYGDGLKLMKKAYQDARVRMEQRFESMEKEHEDQRRKADRRHDQLLELERKQIRADSEEP